MGKYDAHYAFRKKLVDSVERDLIGPTDPDNCEVIEDAPITRYICGVLYPQASGVLDADQDDMSDTDEGDEEGLFPDPPIAMAHVRYPSSMGISFAVDPATAHELKVSVSCARYVPIPEAEQTAGRKKKQASTRWQRAPLNPEPVIVPVDEPYSRTVATIVDGLDVFARVRTPDSLGRVSVTIVLVNTLLLEQNEVAAKDSKAFFQCSLEVTGGHGEEAIFVERPDSRLRGDDEDLHLYRLLYRHAKTFAIGHGCSATWGPLSRDTDRAVRLKSVSIPRFELRLADSNGDLPSYSMQELAQGTRQQVLDELDGLCTSYKQWIDERGTEAESLDGELTTIAAEQLGTNGPCRVALRRMREGVALLREDDVVWEAFRLANSAMLQQRARTEWLKAGKPTNQPVEDSSHAWRPFQIGFILVCLRGISNPAHADRAIADLLWFPTGGGKTEAYLGLIAFTIFLRRLRNPNAGGVTALMRYTLRLLTIQQFERACLLICCCEQIRRRNVKRLGASDISIGLWVGRRATPNTAEQARRALDKLKDGQDVLEMNPMQVQSCPWCGKRLTVENYEYAHGAHPCIVIACKEDACDFGQGLPTHVVDESIYAARPSLLIATVDKFASLPWVEDTSNLFNLNDPQASSPDLIIQDELHLISGPLGTLTGLYETAIDHVCSIGGNRPKVIASTATIRRAVRQVRALFDRDVLQFPPPVIDGRFSFFAAEASPDNKGTRLYVGVMSPAASHTTVLVRVYAALLQFCQDLPETPQVKDAYWSLVGYFNSLRVLGGAKLQVQDDVSDRITLLAAQAGTSERVLTEDKQIEMSSRVASADIPEYLQRMSTGLPDSDTLDVILATNMISVGVDVDRLGLMAVMGQPQATSEYIQATSRVGRKFPGLVVVLFNSARSRDRSHYESFVSYHSALYRQVEATSVTPFSSRARDRALHAVLVSMARMCEMPYRPNTGASNTSNLEAALESYMRAIVARAASVSASERDATFNQLVALLGKWRSASRDCRDLVFRDFKNPMNALLWSTETDEEVPDGKFETPWSLRDVDAASALYLIG